MNLRQLEYFVSVAESLSFTKTAEKFFISQTAVTQQIKTLEDNLDVKLLRRTKRHVELTPAGAVFYTEAKAILTRADDAVAKTKKAATGFTGSLNIGIIGGYDNPRFPDILRSFHTGYPNVSLSFREADTGKLYASLLNRSLDIIVNVCFSKSELEEEGIVCHTLGVYKLIVMLPPSHPLASRSELDLSDLKNNTFIFTATKERDDDFGHYRNTMAHFIRSGFTPNTIYSDNFDITALMVASGMGAAIVPSYALASSRNLGKVVTIPLNKDSDLCEIVIARYKENQNPTIDKFFTYI